LGTGFHGGLGLAVARAARGMREEREWWCLGEGSTRFASTDTGGDRDKGTGWVGAEVGVGAGVGAGAGAGAAQMY